MEKIKKKDIYSLFQKVLNNQEDISVLLDNLYIYILMKPEDISDKELKVLNDFLKQAEKSSCDNSPCYLKPYKDHKAVKDTYDALASVLKS